MVAERGSFSDAAAAGVVLAIGGLPGDRIGLETEFQCALFERRGHSVKATRQGEILLSRVKRAREQLRRAASEFGETRAEAVFGDMMRASDHEYRAFIAGLQSNNGVAGRLFPRYQTALDQPVAVEI